MHTITLLLIVSYLNLFTGVDTTKPAENKHVKSSIFLVEQSLKPGSSGTLSFVLTPVKGIHINLKPAMSLTLDSSAFVSKVGELVTPKDEKTGYLDASQPVTAKITLTKKVSPGTLILKGTFTYFYCSDAEGWCNKYKQPVEIKVNITK